MPFYIGCSRHKPHAHLPRCPAQSGARGGRGRAPRGQRGARLHALARIADAAAAGRQVLHRDRRAHALQLRHLPARLGLGPSVSHKPCGLLRPSQK